MNQRPLRVGYVGSLDPGGTCFSRLEALRSVERDVFALDTDPALNRRGASRMARWLEHVPGIGAGSRRLNAALPCFARANRLNFIWIDKGSWVSSSTLRLLRRAGVRLAQHVTDALRPRNMRLRFTRLRLATTARFYDFYLTSNEPDFDRLRTTLGDRVLLTQLGYDERRFDSGPIQDAQIIERWSSEIIFVGHREPRTERGICALIDAGLPVKVFGRDWLSRAHRNPRLKGRVFGNIGDQEYVWALKLARIGLCFVSEWNYNQTAGRSYEIPASGTFLLAMRTPGHLRHFREGEEAEFFGDETELVEKARRYLADDGVRRIIARRGWQRCTTSGYSWRAIMLRDWAIISDALGAEKI